MLNKDDRWSALSMKERADLINMYITNGISDLKEMKKHYNSFSGEENHPIEVQQGLQNGTIKAIKKDDGTYAYIRQEKPIEDLTQSIAEWTAAGDLMDAGVAIDAVRKGDLKQAALLAGLAVVPNALENTVKLGRRVITHNLHPDKLNAILKGKWDKKMANPSMAIRNIEDITTQEYGPITFLGKPEMLDDSFIFRGDGETSMVSALGLNDVPDVEEISKIMRDYDAKQHSFEYNEPLTKEEVLSNVDLTPSWMGYMEAKRSVPTSPKDFERAFIFTGDYKYDPQIQETLELFRSEGIPYTIYGGRGESLPQAVEGYINRNNPNLLFNNGGKLLTKNTYSGIKNTQTPPMQIMPSDALLQGLYQNTDKLGFERVVPAITTIEQVWEKADKEYDDFIDRLYSLDYKEPFTDDSERVTITAPNTTISKFIFNNKISKNALAEISRVSKLRNQDPYDVLAHMLIEGSGYDITTDTRYNTHDSLTGQIKPKYYNYFKDDRVKQLKQFGIWQKDKVFTVEEILKASEKFNKERDEQLNNVIRAQSYIDEVALRMLLKGRDFNPAQKGYVNSKGEEVKNTYLDMIDSAITSLKENMPDLFK